MATNTLYFPKLQRRSQYSMRKRYTDYRSEIREDCQYRCVYCDAHENVLGGMEAMQLDHYHPQSLFPDLKHNPRNLVWVCNRCNLLKRDDWHPIEPSEISTCSKGYMDPFAVNRGDFFLVEPDGTLTPLGGPAQYMIHRLKLNRSFLTYVRRSRRLLQAFATHIEEYFEEQIKYNQELFSKQAITADECEQHVSKAKAMKEALLEFIQSVSTF